MLLAIEIMLSISAWKRGWKGWVLMPWVALFFGATALGGAAASQEEALAVGIVCDILLIVVLGVVGGALALLLQKHIIIIITSISGAASATWGGWYLGKGIDSAAVVRDPPAAGKDFLGVVASWVIASLLGIVIQYGVTGKPKVEEEEEEEEAEDIEEQPEEEAEELEEDLEEAEPVP